MWASLLSETHAPLELVDIQPDIGKGLCGLGQRADKVFVLPRVGEKDLHRRGGRVCGNVERPHALQRRKPRHCETRAPSTLALSARRTLGLRASDAAAMDFSSGAGGATSLTLGASLWASQPGVS